MSIDDSMAQPHGTSAAYCDYILRQQLAALQPRHIVDFGAGAGKNGSIAREVLGPAVRLTAVEGYEESARHLSASGIYDEVCHSLIQDWVAANAPAQDLAIFGDVLEHLQPREVHAVIRRARERFAHIIVVCPLHEIFQEASYGNPLEIHRTYVTSTHFDRYHPAEKHIVRGAAYTLINVLIASRDDADSPLKRSAQGTFHAAMLVLQPLGLARPFVNGLKRFGKRYKWLINR